MNTRAPAVPIAAVHTPATHVDAALPERVFALGDALEAVAYQLSFVGNARNAAATSTACADLLARFTPLQQQLTALDGDAGALVPRLLATAASAVKACGQAPGRVDDATAEAVQMDFTSFREVALDFSQLVTSAP